jgi:hypothetical protein
MVSNRTTSPILALVGVAALGGACADGTAPRTAAPQRPVPAMQQQPAYGYDQRDRFVGQRGGSTPATRNPVAVGRDETGIVRQGTGTGSAGTRQPITGVRPDGSGSQTVDRGPGVGPPR